MTQTLRIAAVVGIGLLIAPGLVGPAWGHTTTNGVSSNARWDVDGVPIALDQGTWTERSSHRQVGDTECQVHHRGWFGEPTGWIAQGKFVVEKRNFAFEGKDVVVLGRPLSEMDLRATEVLEFDYFVHTHTTLSDACNGALDGAIQAAKTQAEVASHNTFGTAAGPATAKVGVGFGVPLTSFTAGLPGAVCSRGQGSVNGGLTVQWEFEGPARTCVGNVGLVGLDLSGQGSGPA